MIECVSSMHIIVFPLSIIKKKKLEREILEDSYKTIQLYEAECWAIRKKESSRDEDVEMDEWQDYTGHNQK